MYRITKDSNTVVNSELKELRKTDKELALNIRKVYSNLSTKLLEDSNTDRLINAYNGRLGEDIVIEAVDMLADWVSIEETEEVDRLDALDSMEDIVITSQYSDRYDFISYTPIEEMNAKQLGLMLFKELGSEEESRITSMNTGLKIGLDLLDEFKDLYVEANPDSRLEVLEADICNMLALAKLEKGSSLAIRDGQLALYNYLEDERRIDSSNFKFLAEIGGDKTKALDILILDSAFKAYKAAVASGDLEVTSNELNLRIMKVIKGVKTVDKSSMLNRMKKK